jgi:hypothetical protein
MLYKFIFTFCRKKIRSKSLLIKRKQITVFSADIVKILAVFLSYIKSNLSENITPNF